MEQSSIVARFLLCGGQLAGRAQLWCRVLWLTVVVGPLVRVEPVFGETQEEHLSGIRWNVVTCRIAEVEWPGMSMTMEQVVTHTESSSCRRIWTCRTINNLATAQVRKDTPSLIDVKGLGRPKEFSGRERRNFNSGRRRRRHSSLVCSRSLR